MTTQERINEIEDWVGGNVDAQPSGTYDHMALTVLLRGHLEASAIDSQAEIGRLRALLDDSDQFIVPNKQREIDRLRAELTESRGTNAKLNRRCQELESAAASAPDPHALIAAAVQRSGRKPLGRMAANFRVAELEAERERIIEAGNAMIEDCEPMAGDSDGSGYADGFEMGKADCVRKLRTAWDALKGGGK